MNETRLLTDVDDGWYVISQPKVVTSLQGRNHGHTALMPLVSFGNR